MVKKPNRPAARTAKSAAKAKPTKPETKQNIVLALLRRQRGASIAEVVDATSWQPHSVRGFFAGALKKRLAIDVVSEKDAETGERRYFVAPLKS